MREDCDGNVEDGLEWETTQEAVAVVQGRDNSSQLGEGQWEWRRWNECKRHLRGESAGLGNWLDKEH